MSQLTCERSDIWNQKCFVSLELNIYSTFEFLNLFNVKNYIKISLKINKSVVKQYLSSLDVYRETNSAFSSGT
jgi:hypothetical protein